MTDILSMEDHELWSKLKAMRLTAMAEALEDLLRDPNSDLVPFREKVGLMVDGAITRSWIAATLKYPHADLDDTIYDPERLLDAGIIEDLAKCKWVEEGRNLMVTGKTGSGKSYPANALAISTLRQFKTVRYCKASHLIDELNRAEAIDSYREALAVWVSFDLLVIDDFGLVQLDLNKCRNLFEVLESRDLGRSAMVISQFPVTAWYDLFQEQTYTDACLNRLPHKSCRLEMNG